MSASTNLGCTLAIALGRSEPLDSLMQRVQASRARLAAIAHLLPAGLAAGVRAGPLDDTGWQILVDNAASSAKLRQLLPTLKSTLDLAGLATAAIRIKVLPRG